MKAKQFILTKMTLFISIALTLSLISCEKDDDGNGSEPPANTNHSFEVQLLDMKGTSISDAESGELEIYGTISSTLLVGSFPDRVDLWSTTEDEFLVVTAKDIEIGTKTIFTIDSEDIEQSSIRLSADLMEFDWGNPDDPVGDESSIIQLSEIAELEIVELVLDASSSNSVRIRFTIKPV